ncbi:MAG: HD-GYP domain-containing protein [Solirubrobacterales bacterium]|nr:HD-GYP domain-containing protein [Solirubrobacterales bacterium]
MIALTTTVLLVPCIAAIGLRASETVTSPVLLILLPVLLSMAISWAIAEIWKRRADGGPVLFDDLMIWGWLRNRRFERLLGRAEDFIGPDAGQADPRRRARELERLSAALEARDPRTHGHSRRVARHASQIARRLKLPAESVARIRTAALLHDVGKIRIPIRIIEKPGALTEAEFALVKTHSEQGSQLVAGMGDPELASIIRHHHERIDGGGYPDGLRGEEIPLGARIIAVADTFDAVTSARSYRGPRSHEDALALLDREAGAQLDPEAVSAFESRYSGRRPVAIAAAALGLGRQAAQTLIGLGTGASQVAAVGAAAVVIGTAPAANLTPRDEPDERPAQARQAASDPSRTEVAATAGGTVTATGSGPDRAQATGASDPARDGAIRGQGQAHGSDPRPGAGSGGGTEGAGGETGGSGDGEGTGDGGSGGSGGSGSEGGSSGSGSQGGSGSEGGSEGSGGSSGGSSGAAALQQTVQKVTQTVTDAVPTLPGKDPVSQGVNETVGSVKDILGKVTGKP